jgi:hypothetical protein
MQATVARYLVTNGRVSGVAVKLGDGVREIPVGIVPSTELLTPQLPRHATGSVSADEWLQASDGLLGGASDGHGGGAVASERIVLQDCEECLPP